MSRMPELAERVDAFVSEHIGVLRESRAFFALPRIDVEVRSINHGYITKQEGNGLKDERATMKMASEVKSYFIFELSDFDYPGIHVHIASNSHSGGL